MSSTTKLVILFITALGILFVTTQPNQLPSFVLILPFLVVFLLFFVVAKAGLQKTGMVGSSLGLAILIAGLPVILLAMQSLGQLTGRDIIMISALFMIAYFYMYRRARSSN